MKYSTTTCLRQRMMWWFSLLKQRAILRENSQNAIGFEKYTKKDDITAIQLSTASGAAEVVSMLGEGLLKPGFVKQENLSFERFIKGEFGCIFA